MKLVGGVVSECGKIERIFKFGDKCITEEQKVQTKEGSQVVRGAKF